MRQIQLARLMHAAKARLASAGFGGADGLALLLRVAHGARGAFVDGLGNALWIAAGISLLAGIAAKWLWQRVKRQLFRR